MLFPEVAAGFDEVLCLEADTAFCLVTVLLAAEEFAETLVAVELLLDELLPTVPRLVLELVPTPLLTTVLPESVNPRESVSVSYLGPYEVFDEKCPPCPWPGPPW